MRAVMSWEIPQIDSAGIFPSVENIEAFSNQLKSAMEINNQQQQQQQQQQSDSDPSLLEQQQQQEEDLESQPDSMQLSLIMV